MHSLYMPRAQDLVVHKHALVHSEGGLAPGAAEALRVYIWGCGCEGVWDRAGEKEERHK